MADSGPARGVEHLWKGLTEEAQEAITQGWQQPGLYEVGVSAGDVGEFAQPPVTVEAPSISALVAGVHDVALYVGDPTSVTFLEPLDPDDAY